MRRPDTQGGGRHKHPCMHNWLCNFTWRLGNCNSQTNAVLSDNQNFAIPIFLPMQQSLGEETMQNNRRKRPTFGMGSDCSATRSAPSCMQPVYWRLFSFYLTFITDRRMRAHVAASDWWQMWCKSTGLVFKIFLFTSFTQVDGHDFLPASLMQVVSTTCLQISVELRFCSVSGAPDNAGYGQPFYDSSKNVIYINCKVR